MTTAKETFMVETTVALVNIANRHIYNEMTTREKVEIIHLVSSLLLENDYLRRCNEEAK